MEDGRWKMYDVEQSEIRLWRRRWLMLNEPACPVGRAKSCICGEDEKQVGSQQ
ncbi:MAG TPA: hypothetical protein VLH59_14030 [Ignavibacteriaceae bacterium]|nr:hypothetical protein [Ignavibacteriaceae bacterium]